MSRVVIISVERQEGRGSGNLGKNQRSRTMYFAFFIFSRPPGQRLVKASEMAVSCTAGFSRSCRGYLKRRGHLHFKATRKFRSKRAGNVPPLPPCSENCFLCSEDCLTLLSLSNCVSRLERFGVNSRDTMESFSLLQIFFRPFAK